MSSSPLRAYDSVQLASALAANQALLFRKLPPLETVGALAHTLAAVGFPLLTLGILTGIVGVETARLQSSEYTIKLLAAMVTWIVYGAYLLAHHTAGWRGKRANWILILGAIFIVLTTALHKFA